ncbi:MAG: PSD1 and planctomycete cytochrome C domain-containing protein [Planctomycetota bacterium]
MRLINRSHTKRLQGHCYRELALAALLALGLLAYQGSWLTSGYTGTGVRADETQKEGQQEAQKETQKEAQKETQQEAKKPEPVTFEGRITTIFKERCWKCHAGAEPRHNLRLTTRQELLKGGDGGPAIRIAAAESSLLWAKIVSDEMPAGGPPLSKEDKAVIRTWINDGAKGAEAGADGDSLMDANAGETAQLWSFVPPVRPAIPAVRQTDRVLNPIDAFILAKLESQGLTLSPEADAGTLRRRLHFDLLGLPPAVDELMDGENQSSSGSGPENSLEGWVERLLANPAYGERWARHWLDVAGYADSAGVLAEDRPLPTAYRYRDYVVRAFNKDKPYDRFLQEQLAGDELSDYWTADATSERLSDEVVEAITATGFLRCAPDSSRPDFSTIKNADAQYFYPTLNDTLQIVASSTMGVTLQCARCHSHKYDPIPQVDYYRLQAVFMAALRPTQWIPQMERRLLVATAAERKRAADHNSQLDAEVTRLQKEQTERREAFKQRLFTDRLNTLPEVIRADVQMAVKKPADQRSPVEVYLAEKFAAQLQPDNNALDKQLPESYPEYKQATAANAAAVAEQQRRRIAFDEIRALYDVPGPVVTPLLRRGDALTPGAAVEPGVLTALKAPDSFQWKTPEPTAKTTGRRLAFARWLTQPQHPLTARVFVNRLWLHHFGEGLVATPEDFGTIGAKPSHPELLDWLATELVQSNWSVKHLQRLIVTSATYRQQSRVEAQSTLARDGARVDPDNRLLWRQRLRRLEAEPVHDAVLEVSGLLDRRMFGAPLPVARQGDGEVTVANPAADRRRAIYIQILRLNPLTILQAFDQPVMETNCTRRVRSTVSTQALTLMNSELLQTAATALADRVLRVAAGQSDPAKSEAATAVWLAFGRPIAAAEREQLVAFRERQAQQYRESGVTAELAQRQSLVDLCHMLMAANEFIYID